MLYVPKNFLNNTNNADKVYEILEKLDTDIEHEDSYSKEDAIKELEHLKENIVVEKLKDGFFIFGA